MATRTVKMIKTMRGCDPVLVQTYTEGETYRMGKDLANAFITQGVATRVRKKKDPGPAEVQEEVPPSDTATDEEGSQE